MEPAFQRMSVEEYLRTEELSPDKREYVDGFVYPLHGQAGASKPHVRITGNITATLNAAARQSGCRLYSSDMKLRLQGSRTFFYPDILLACGPDNPEDAFETEPCLLAEVLSPSTAAHDRTGKFSLYTALPSLQTYLLVEQAERRVYAYARQGGEWVLTEFRGEGEIDLPCLGRALSLQEIYVGVLV
ncbi:Uma2 family endonuclease [Deinococcus arenicola]|uniref:Uma2 family endonuclease n=1 Tax=Deinococcus arenicola TaxID=2994950 RepID=A0ABU4DLZ8_9DEIO|nr:Uma2 family endonuclease [Deinococcus sp. ZS9-10]MDV6373463.1 Uma2 family endonuclease [Deinococcus sp. ZS9-10]